MKKFIVFNILFDYIRQNHNLMRWKKIRTLAHGKNKYNKHKYQDTHS